MFASLSTLHAENGSKTTRFRYTVADRDGRIEHGSLSSTSVAAAIAELSSRGVFVVNVRQTNSSVLTALINLKVGRSIGLEQSSVTLRALATLLNAGLPVSKAITALHHIAPPAVRPELPVLEQSVREGSTLSAALNSSGLSISSVNVGIIRAGEYAGNLRGAVTRAAELTERTVASRNALRNALLYPFLLLVVGLSACVLLVTVVIPRFERMFGDMGQSLPSGAQLIMDAAALARNGLFPFMLFVSVALFALHIWSTQERGRTEWHRFLLKIPLIGGIRHATATSHFCSALGELLEGGVPISPALHHSAFATGDAEISRRVLSAKSEIEQGESVATALASNHAVTGSAIALARTGEEGGCLGMMLKQAGHLEAEHAQARIRILVKLLEPAMILLFGGLVAAVAASMLKAIYGFRVTV